MTVLDLVEVNSILRLNLGRMNLDIAESDIEGAQVQICWDVVVAGLSCVGDLG